MQGAFSSNFAFFILITIQILLIWAYISSTSISRHFLKTFMGNDLMADVIAESRNRIGYFKLIAILFSLVLWFSVFNFEFSFISGWINLAIIGLSVIWAVYLLFEIEILKLNRERLSNPENTEIKLRISGMKAFSNTSMFSIALVFSIICGYWAYQVNKNENERQNWSTMEILSLSGQGWCGEFADIDVYDSGSTVVKSGGWPCISIGSITNISFTNEKDKSEMCFVAFFNEESGSPEDESFYLDVYRNRFCASMSAFRDGWVKEDFDEVLFNYVKPRLDTLQKSMCNWYGSRMTYENYLTYCSDI